MAEMVAKEGVTLKQALAQVVQQTGEYRTQRIDLHVDEARKGELMRRFREEPPASLNGLRVVSTNSLDGVKLLLEEEAWVLVRPSGTEPLIRCYIEAHDEEVLNGLKAAMQKLVG